MSATIYRIEGTSRMIVATFSKTDDALRCFKSIAYNLNERLVMEATGPTTVVDPPGCHRGGGASGNQYVLFPAFGTDRFQR